MKRKLMTGALIVAMMAILVAGASLAYFTDTDTATNTFTMGNVDISLTESEWNPQETHTLMPGASFEKNPTVTVEAGSQDCYVFLEIDLNKYVSLINLMGVDAYKNNIGGLEGTYPGFTAFCTNLIGDNDLRAAVLDRWFVGVEHSDWTVMNVAELQEVIASVAQGENPSHLKVVLGYNDVMKANDEVTFMTNFAMPATITQSMLDGEDAYKINDVSKSNFNTKNSNFNMKITAYAIQEAEIADLAAAYTALFK